ncbi:hypothetical protein EXU57_17940 [Segetibacter sp. 3557_3]|uniref:hypothetical protein n=1 Tax=Segetibacter sp. 3557_3 TaxID=2547429 RepID=UPI001059122B|nr:hypothetical protein [Segetibacter sp. 3557_3]TDH23353.1 hypothetical protein EXU57_17940 [Segetibacter sp. 3557_3]
MKYVVVLICLFIGQLSYAQDVIPEESTYHSLNPEKSIKTKKWSFNTFQGFSAGFSRGFSTYSAPMGVQLSRALNNNVFAFGAVSIAPTYMNFNRSFLTTDFSKGGNNNFFRTGNLGVNPRAELGLGYTNDARTFSISGSIGIEQSSYGYPFGGFLPYQVIQPVKGFGSPF